MDLIAILALMGLLLSVYALLVERTAKEGKRTLCDISEHISCTRAFAGPYGHLFRIPNPVIGIAGYLLLIVWPRSLLFTLTAPALFLTIVLAYLSYVKQKNFCLVCSATYMINITLFALSF